MRLDRLERVPGPDAPLSAGDVRSAHPGGDLEPRSGSDHCHRHRVPAGAGAPDRRRLRRQRALELLQRRQHQRMEHARGPRARRRSRRGSPLLPAPQVAVRDRGRLAGAGHARDAQHDGDGEGRVRPGLQDAVRVRHPRRRRLSRGAGEPAPRLSRSRADPGRPRCRGLRRRQRPRRARTLDRVGEGTQHQLHRCEDAGFPDGTAPDRRGRRLDRHRAAS